MRLSTLFPDELAGTYLTRLCNENVLHSHQELAHELRVAGVIEHLPVSAAALLEEILAVLEMSVHDLVCLHSLAPVQKCVFSYGYGRAAPPNFCEKRYLRFAAFKQAVGRLCPDCVAEDLDYWGVSYWRRLHQLPEITWCLKHMRPLGLVTGAQASDISPDLAVKFAVEQTSGDLGVFLDSPTLQRYASIMVSLLENARSPIHYACAGKVIRDRARLKGLQVGPSKIVRTPRYLSDEAMEQIPTHWLQLHFPASAKKRKNEFSPWIDCTGHIRKTPARSAKFGLALALLWDDPDEAVTEFLSAQPKETKLISRVGPLGNACDSVLQQSS